MACTFCIAKGAQFMIRNFYRGGDVTRQRGCRRFMGQASSL